MIRTASSRRFLLWQQTTGISLGSLKRWRLKVQDSTLTLWVQLDVPHLARIFRHRGTAIQRWTRRMMSCGSWFESPTRQGRPAARFSSFVATNYARLRPVLQGCAQAGRRGPTLRCGSRIPEALREHHDDGIRHGIGATLVRVDGPVDATFELRSTALPNHSAPCAVTRSVVPPSRDLGRSAETERALRHVCRSCPPSDRIREVGQSPGEGYGLHPQTFPR